ADDDGDRAGGYLQVEVAQHRLAPERFPQAFDLDHRLASPAAAARTTTITGSPRRRLRLAQPRSSGEDRAHEVVPDEDQHRREDNRLGRRPRDALGAVADVEALVGADPRDDDAERDGLPEPGHDVLHVD